MESVRCIGQCFGAIDALSDLLMPSAAASARLIR